MAFVNLSKVNFHYPVFEVTGRSLKVSVMRQIVGSRITGGAGHIKVQALQNVSFGLKDGDRLGLLGRNGSGKTTLLRILAGVAYPSKGQATVEGRVVSLIERGLGMNSELSGRANIELPLRLLGASTSEVAAAMKEIPEWTGLGQFIDLPIRTYSEGMRARLLFAICTALPSDVLVLDEWLGAGDAEFINRAEERLKHMLTKTSIVVLASHSMDTIERFCNVVIWMDRGRIIQKGPPSEVIPAYLGSVASDVQSDDLVPQSEVA